MNEGSSKPPNSSRHADADEPRLAQLLVALAHVCRLHDLAVLQARGLEPAGARSGLELGADVRARLEQAAQRAALRLHVGAVTLSAREEVVPVDQLLEVEDDGVVEIGGHMTSQQLWL